MCLGGCRTFFKMVNILTYTCPNHSGVGVIDSPDRFEHVSNQYYILEVPGKFFRDENIFVRAEKLAKNAFFGVFKAFISDFLSCNLSFFSRDL